MDDVALGTGDGTENPRRRADRVRVLHMIKGLGPGGAEQLLVNQAQATADPSIDFHVAYLVSWKSHLAPTLEAAGWTVHGLRSDRSWDLRWLPRFRQLVAAGGFDVVHGHSPLVSALTRLMLLTVRRRARPRSIYTEHNEWGRHRPATRRLNRLTIGREDALVAVSAGVRASMPTKLDVDVLLHGIDGAAVASQVGHRDDVRAELGIDEDEVVIGIVANLRREKAYDVLLEAAATVIDDHPNIRFVSVGQGPLETEIRDQHRSLDLGDRFLLLGYRSDATRIMSAFDIFTLTSHHEGLPVALMEALAIGLPVVATTVGGIAEAVDPDRSILIGPGDVAALRAGYLEMVRRVRAGETERLRSDSRFDSAQAAGVLAARYRSLSCR